jgi:hypothetical protein
MHFYRQSILVFGLILPLTVAVALVVASYLFKTSIEDSYRHNIAGYKSSDGVRLASLAIEGKIIRQRPDMERWNALLNQETASTVTDQLRAVINELSPKELQQTAYMPSAVKAGLGSLSAQKSSQVQIAFRGTFHTMQRAFLELETRLPQLQLQDLKIDPNTNQSSLLNFQVTYTAWEN